MKSFILCMLLFIWGVFFCFFLCQSALQMRLGMTFVRKPQYMWALAETITAPEKEKAGWLG